MLLKEAALAYAARGWPVFPCRADKAPLVREGFHAATTDPGKIEAWWAKFPEANIGFSPGHAGLVVVDLDIGHDLAYANGLPETALEQRTPSGGKHLFYALGNGETCKSPAGKIAPKVDVRSNGAYVLLPPSRTPKGEYKWEKQGNPAYRPGELLRQANSSRPQHPEKDVWIIEPDMPVNVDRARNWLGNTAMPAIEGQGGDHATVSAASMLRSFGVSESTALDLMLEVFNPRCSPPWDEADMVVKVRNGYMFANGQPGESTPAYRAAKARELFKPVAPDAATDEATWVGRFRAVDRDGMELIKPPAWLIHDCIPEGGYVMLFGPPGGFKTFVALDMALSVATGVTFPWQGMWPRVSRSGPVLFAVGEGRANIVKRVAAWEHKHWHGHRVNNFIMVDPVPRVSEPLTDFLQLGLNMSPEGYALVVIDTVGRAMQSLNENSQEHASKLTMQVEEMQKAFGCAVLALHHTGHGNGDRAKGSITFESDADTMIRVDRREKTNLMELVMTKQKDAPEWPAPKLAEAYEVTLPSGAKSLAVSLPSEESVEACKAPEPESDDAMLSVIEKAVEKVLKSIKGRSWSQKALAESVAMEDTITISSGALARRWLTTLREDSNSKASAWYDPATAKWRMSGSAS